jgi:cytoskeleton protein RodZ
MDSVGNFLRCERLRRDLSLEQVAAQTKISRRFLEAMEANRFDRLPAGLLTRSFMRQFARTLGLDDEKLMASFREQFEEPAIPMPAPLPTKTSILPSLGWLVVTVLLGGAVSDLWQNGRQSSPEHRIPKPSLAQVPAPVEHRQPALSAQTPRTISSGSVAVRVVFSTTEPVWMSIESDGNQVYSGTLAGQQDKELEASGKMIALIGNAGGVEVSLNGTPMGSLGQHGQVRLLELTPNGGRLVSR